MLKGQFLIKWKKISLFFWAFFPLWKLFSLQFLSPPLPPPHVCWYFKNHSGWSQDSESGKMGMEAQWSAIVCRSCKTEINLSSFTYLWCPQCSQDFRIFPRASIFWVLKAQFPCPCWVLNFSFFAHEVILFAVLLVDLDAEFSPSP